MAEIKDGILGGVHGKVGTVVGFMWRGKYYIRSRPRKSHKRATGKQVAQRSKLAVASGFVSKFREFVNAHYPPALLNDKMASGREQLISMLMKEGMTNIEGEPCVEIANVLVSMGSLPPAVVKKVNQLKTGRIKVLWDNSITNILAKNTDRLSIVAYSEELHKVVVIESIAKREDKYVHFDLPKDWVEGKVHFWSVWKSAEGKLISTSAYHGMLEIAKEVEETEGQVKEESSDDNVNKSDGDKTIISLESLAITDKTSEKVSPTEQKKPDISADDKPKKWAPPGFYSRRNKSDKVEEPNVQQDKEEQQEEGPRSVLEALR